MSISSALERGFVRALRVPAPYVPGWFPLVVERAHGFLPPKEEVRTVELLGSRMTLDLGEYVQRRFYYHCYENSAVGFFRRWIRPGDVALDVGAHVGLFTLLAASLVGEGGRVHAFEPVPDNFERLARNVALNGLTNTHVNRLAVFDHEGEVGLGLSKGKVAGETTGDFTVGGQVATVTASSVTLDAYLERFETGPLRLVKIDVEGSEPSVLIGMARTLSEAPPAAIVFEHNARMLLAQGNNPTAAFEQLRSHGYRIHRLGPSGALRRLPGDERLTAAARRMDLEESKSRLAIVLHERSTFFNAVAIHPLAGR
jgi:FkbM family methyltransferase